MCCFRRNLRHRISGRGRRSRDDGIISQRRLAATLPILLGLAELRMRNKCNRTHVRESLLLKILSALLLTLLLATAVPCQGQPQSEMPSPLELRIRAPLKWKKGCLILSVDRINHAPRTHFLPHHGLYIYTSVTEVPNEAGKKNGVEWINVYGFSDIGDWDAEPIAPGKTVHSEYCLAANVAAISEEQKTRREISVRGGLRIDAFYFLTKEDWETNRGQKEEMLKLSDDELKRMNVLYPQMNTIILPVPCSEVPGCTVNCETPPDVLYGEMRVVPDVDERWDGRGRAINEEIERKSQRCAGSKSASP